ncbi:MAG: replication-associated recombination protein A [Bacteroidetes bacterium]|nr:MAG: replication-associated recombination protein A [Bacteroidota bacterium]
MIPLAECLRPKDLDHYFGQDHLVGKDSVLRKAIESGRIPSMILWGPPGVGKTTLANIIASGLKRPFYTLSAVHSGVKDVRELIDRAIRYSGELKEVEGNAILFIDEIHRFSKSQQDSLLHAVERGYVTLIGATTENPSFEVISPLLSRCQVYVLKELGKEDLLKIISYAIENAPSLKKRKIHLEATNALLRLSGGDARKLLNLLELTVNSYNEEEDVIISDEVVQKLAQEKSALYDKGGEQHYDIISAFIKSIRGSDPNAAVYWLARMIHGGEDPMFIARRMLILASEDIGNANPTALVIATACFEACYKTGYPECRIILSEKAIYLASSAKSNASYMAIEEALQLVRQSGDLPVPLHIRNAPTKLMKELGYSEGYEYDHSKKDSFAGQEFMPEQLSGKQLYNPGSNPREMELREFLKQRWKEKYGY